MSTVLGGAPIGSHNRANGKLAQNALKRVLAREFGSLDAGLEVAAAVMVRKLKRGHPTDPNGTVSDGALEAAAEAADKVFDRIDGKASQALSHTGPDGGPVQVQVIVITDAMMAKLTAEQLDAFERAIPALEVLGLASFVPAGAGEAGGAEEA